jgi:hypothetical protein
MTTFLRWVNNPVVVVLLLTAGALTDLVLLGRAYDLGKSDWASWIQAVGSIAAIAGAFAITQVQAGQQRKLLADQSAEELRNMLRAVISIGEEGISACDNALTTFRREVIFDEAAIEHVSELFSAAIEVTGQFPFWRLNEEGVRHFAQLRIMLARARTSVRGFNNLQLGMLRHLTQDGQPLNGEQVRILAVDATRAGLLEQKRDMTAVVVALRAEVEQV